MADNLSPRVRSLLWQAAQASAEEYTDARWPDTAAHPLFVHQLAEHFLDYYRRADDEACDTLTEQGESPRDFVADLDAQAGAEALMER